MSETGTAQDQATGKDGQPPINADDLDLVDDTLDDEGKSDAELWDDLEKVDADAAAGAAADDKSAADADGALADDFAADSDDSKAETGKQEAAPEDEPSGKSDKEPPDTQGAGQDDPWTDAPESLRTAHEADLARIQKLEQSDRSQRGRLAAAQRQLNEVTQKLASKPPPAADAAAGDGKDSGSEDADELFNSDEWKDHEKEYPEVAKPTKSLINKLVSRIDTLEQKQGNIDEDRRQDDIDEQEDLLLEKHPDWLEVTAAEGYDDWLQQQPRHVKEAAIRNADAIVDAEEAADVVSRFKAFQSEQGEEKPSGDNANAGNGKGDGATNADAGKGGGSKRLSGRRQRQLEAASSTRDGGPGAVQGIPEDGDPQAIWDAFDAKERRQAQGA